MKITELVLALSVCILSIGILVADVNVTGNWEMTISTPRGERVRPVEFIQDGEALIVISEGREGQKLEAKGSVKGNEVEWKMLRETQRGSLEITYEGKVEGDKMSGTVQFGTRGSGEWSAKRLD